MVAGALRLFRIAHSVIMKEYVRFEASIYFSLCVHLSIAVLSNLRCIVNFSRSVNDFDQHEELSAMLLQLLDEESALRHVDREFGLLSATCAAGAA